MICRGGRSAADGRLANPVRSGRKQPQRGSARGGRPASHPVAPTSGPARRPPRPRIAGLCQDDSQIEAPPPPEGPGLFGDAPTAPEPVHATPYRVLARKYRPTSFNDLIGQEAMVRILRNAFATGRVAHAFMLTGVRGVGKTTTARIIARAMNCIGPDGSGGPTVDPCGVCANCT